MVTTVTIPPLRKKNLISPSGHQGMLNIFKKQNSRPMIADNQSNTSAHRRNCFIGALLR
jgi:hypothetical protein